MTRNKLTVADLAALYAGAEADKLYDEVVTEHDHALQSAALAAEANACDKQVAAALLHDLGHLLLADNVPISVQLTVNHHHDEAGAQALEALFGPAVAEPVRLHVEAKRYLCGIDASYHDQLSPSSIRSLAVQGGPMTSAECSRFEQRAYWRQAIEVRLWDDQAKVEDALVPDFAAWTPLLVELASTS